MSGGLIGENGGLYGNYGSSFDATVDGSSAFGNASGVTNVGAFIGLEQRRRHVDRDRDELVGVRGRLRQRTRTSIASLEPILATRKSNTYQNLPAEKRPPRRRRRAGRRGPAARQAADQAAQQAASQSRAAAGPAEAASGGAQALLRRRRLRDCRRDDGNGAGRRQSADAIGTARRASARPPPWPGRLIDIAIDLSGVPPAVTPRRRPRRDVVGRMRRRRGGTTRSRRAAHPAANCRAAPGRRLWRDHPLDRGRRPAFRPAKEWGAGACAPPPPPRRDPPAAAPGVTPNASRKVDHDVSFAPGPAMPASIWPLSSWLPFSAPGRPSRKASLQHRRRGALRRTGAGGRAEDRPQPGRSCCPSSSSRSSRWPAAKPSLVRQIDVTGGEGRAGGRGRVARDARPYEGGKLTLAPDLRGGGQGHGLYREHGYLVAKAYVPAQDARSGFADLQISARAATAR